MATLVDTRGIAKCPSHDGKEQTWQEFAFKFENYLALLGWSWVVEDYLAHPGHIAMEALGEEAKTISRNLYAILAQ
eukprot:2894209-Amphidinium_carterae.1